MDVLDSFVYNQKNGIIINFLCLRVPVATRRVVCVLLAARPAYSGEMRSENTALAYDRASLTLEVQWTLGIIKTLLAD